LSTDDHIEIITKLFSRTSDIEENAVKDGSYNTNKKGGNCSLYISSFLDKAPLSEGDIIKMIDIADKNTQEIERTRRIIDNNTKLTNVNPLYYTPDNFYDTLPKNAEEEDEDDQEIEKSPIERPKERREYLE
jgi:hypothetical protein